MGANSHRYIVSICLLLSGCATDQYQWKQTRPPSEKPWVYIYALDTDTLCRGLGSKVSFALKIQGCSIWKERGCVIVIPENPPKWLIEHEEKHCEGWDH